VGEIFWKAKEKRALFLISHEFEIWKSINKHSKISLKSYSVNAWKLIARHAKEGGMTAFDLSFFLLARNHKCWKFASIEGRRARETSDRIVIRVSDVPAN
jgi:hypothetical protein